MGGATGRVKPILDSLNQQMGSGFDVSTSSPKYVENLAAARVLAGMNRTAERLGNCTDPDRMSGKILARWEKILDLRPKRTDTPKARRTAVRQKRELVGQPILRAFLVERLTADVGSFFVDLEYVPFASAVVHVPDGTYPWGTVSAGYPWMSTLEHLLVRLQVPAGATEGDFYEAAGKVTQFLSAVLPSTVTFDWYRAPASTPIAVAGGPSAAGFYLDDAKNLDNNIFDV
jgi:hypothetical protein